MNEYENYLVPEEILNEVLSQEKVELDGLIIMNNNCTYPYLDLWRKIKSLKLNKNKLDTESAKVIFENLYEIRELRVLNNMINITILYTLIRSSSNRLTKFELGGNNFKSDQIDKLLKELSICENLIEVKIYSNGVDQDVLTSFITLIKRNPLLESIWITGEYEENLTRRRSELETKKFLQEISKLNNLCQLGINGFKVDQELLISIFETKHMTHLDLRNVHAINDRFLMYLETCKKLQYIGLAGTKITNTIGLCNSLMNCPSLKYVNFSELNFGPQESLSKLSELISHLANIEMILLSKIGLSSDSMYLESFFKSFSQKDTITHLDLSHNLFGNKGLEYLRKNLNSNKLISINLEDCEIGDDGLKSISKMIEYTESLRFLSLNTNSFGRQGLSYLVKSLSGKKFFEYIRLGNTNIGDDCEAEISQLIQQCISLKTMDLSCNFSERTIEKLFDSGKPLFLEDLKTPIDVPKTLSDKIISERLSKFEKLSSVAVLAERRFNQGIREKKNNSTSMHLENRSIDQDLTLELTSLKEKLEAMKRSQAESERKIEELNHQNMELEDARKKSKDLTAQKEKEYQESRNELENRLKILLQENEKLKLESKNKSSSSTDIGPPHTASTNHISTTLLRVREKAVESILQDKVLLGEGGYGKVFKGKLNSVEVAVKVLSSDSLQGKEEFFAEVELLSKYRCKYLVSLVAYSHSVDFKHCYLLYEYMSNGNLEDAIKSKKLVNAGHRLKIAMYIAKGMQFLQESDPDFPIFHRDLKPANILLDDNMEAKIGDFGLMKKGTISIGANQGTYITQNIKGTPIYICPEYMRSGQVSLKTDVFSYGVILTELFTGKIATVETEKMVMYGLEKKKYDFLDEVMTSFQSNPLNQMTMKCLFHLAQVCLKPYRHQRPGFRRIVSIFDEVEKSGKFTEFVDEENEVENERMCIICRSNPISTLFLPCRHSSTCMECANNITRCPICHQPIRNTIQGNYTSTFVS